MGRIGFRRALLSLGAVAALAVTLRGAGPAPSSLAPPVFVPSAVATLDGRGGAIAHEGATLSVPPGALREPTELAMATTVLPAPLAKGFRAASPVLRLTKPSPERFATPVLLTLPVDATTALGETVALYWDVEHELYRTLTVTRRDEAARTVTFETVHFTDFLVAGPDGTLPPLPAVDTGFRPERDAFFFTNGDYDSSGTCLGMSLLSTWYFETHKNQKGAPSLHDLMASFHPVADTADLVGREMALAAQSSAIPPGQYLAKASKAALDEAQRKGPVASGVALVEQLRATGTPQLLVIQGPRGAHAIVAYAFDGKDFLIYDPNYPGQVKRMSFDRETGFHDWTGTDLGQPMDVAPVSFSSYASDVDFQKIFDKALADKGTPSRYETVTISSAKASGADLVVTGTVKGGLPSPHDPTSDVSLVVGSRQLGSGTVGDDGRFTIRVPLADVASASQSEHAAPAIVLGPTWGFAGAARVPAPSKTKGVAKALEGSATSH